MELKEFLDKPLGQMPGLVKHTGMAEYCCIEYRNLCEILPMLYAEYK